MSGKLVSIKFCGGCNPRIDRARIAEKVREELTAYGCDIIFNSLDADFIIYLSGCTAACAYRYGNCTKPCAQAAAATLDTEPVDEAELASLLCKKARDYFEQLERPLPR